MEVVSIFSGCGGFDLGFDMAGYNIIFANDISDYACQTYENNFQIKPIKGNIINITEFPHADILIGCCPCQGFSIYGKREMEDPRNYLYLQFTKALRKVKPKYFVTENVKGILYGYGKVIFKRMLTSYKKSGYIPYYLLINAKQYGVPQDRERLFIVGIRKDINKTYEFPSFTNGDGLEPFSTIKDSIGNLGKPKDGEYWDGTFSSHYMSRNRRRGWDQTSFTIQANGRHAPLHPSSPTPIKVKKDVYKFPDDGNIPRRMSVKECARIQSFPDRFKFKGSLDSQYEQIGNAVPPQVSKILAESLLNL